MTVVLETRGRKRSRGITLIELMIALAIIAISLFAILSMVVNMMAMRESAREKELAKEWVQQKLEEVKSRPFTDLKTVAYVPAGGATLYSATFATPSTPPQLPNAAGVLAVDYSNANLYEIVASITWKGRMGNGSYSMRNLYSK
jgi:type II secretory pathway pseudopilin PulG